MKTHFAIILGIGLLRTSGTSGGEQSIEKFWNRGPFSGFKKASISMDITKLIAVPRDDQGTGMVDKKNPFPKKVPCQNWLRTAKDRPLIPSASTAVFESSLNDWEIRYPEQDLVKAIKVFRQSISNLSLFVCSIQKFSVEKQQFLTVGTGLYLGNGEILTAEHVILKNGLLNLSVVSISGERRAVRSVIRKEANYDVAIVGITPFSNSVSVRHFELDTELPSGSLRGNPVAVVGFPQVSNADNLCFSKAFGGEATDMRVSPGEAGTLRLGGARVQP